MGARIYEVSRTINASETKVWELLTDAGRYADWNDAVISIIGPIEQGGTIELVSVANPKRTFTLEVTEMLPPRRMVWSDGMPLGLFRGERAFTIEPTGDGAVEFTMTERFSGPLARLITKAIPDLTDSFNLFADGLKVAAESDG